MQNSKNDIQLSSVPGNGAEKEPPSASALATNYIAMQEPCIEKAPIECIDGTVRIIKLYIYAISVLLIE